MSNFIIFLYFQIRNQPVNDQNDSVIPEAEIIIEQNLADVEEDSLFQSPPGPLPGSKCNILSPIFRTSLSGVSLVQD